MKFPGSVPLLSLCLLLMFGIGGCAELLLGKSYQDFHNERHERTIVGTTAKLEKNTYDAGLYVTRGWAYFCAHKYEKALSDFSRAIAIDPENAAAYRGRGNASRAADFQAPPDGVIRHPHKGYVADINKANILEPGKLDEEINQDFGYVSNVTSEFIYPVPGACFAEIDLILGSTTTTQAAEMLPPKPYDAYGPVPVYRPTKPLIGKVGQVVANVRYKYAPNLSLPYTGVTNRSLLLVFDKNDKLVVIRNIDAMLLKGIGTMLDDLGNERLKKISRERYKKYRDLMRQHQFSEVYRETILHELKVMRAEITPCVTVDISVPAEPEPEPASVIYIVEYIYTCSTK